jgi:hypothetical protein
MIPVNAWTDTLLDNKGAVNWWFGQGLISARIKDSLLDPKGSCRLDKGALWRTWGPNELSAKCNAIRDKVGLSIIDYIIYSLLMRPNKHHILRRTIF